MNVTDLINPADKGVQRYIYEGAKNYVTDRDSVHDVPYLFVCMQLKIAHGNFINSVTECLSIECIE